MRTVGILAFGSLIEDQGKELGPLVHRRIENVETPFPVEIARTSSSRGGAPTVIPVERGGAQVRAVILVLGAEVEVERAANLLWRRETRNECGDKHYKPPSNPSVNHVVVKHLNNYCGIETVLYTSIGTNISDATPERLAELAIESAKGEAGKNGKDGISYLISLKRHGVQTPLMPKYEAAILEKTGAPSLETSLERIKVDRTTAINAVDTLNDFVGDFVSGVMLLREYDVNYRAGRVTLPLMVTVQKICLSHIVLSLCKFVEFYERFHQMIPSQHREVCKGLIRTINQKGIIDFRNKCVGHIWDTDRQRPLLNSEIMGRLEHMTGNDLNGFLNWVNDPKGNTYPSTVVSIVESVRDSLMKQRAISPEEAINR